MTEETTNAENVEQLAPEGIQDTTESAPAAEESTRDRGAERRIKQLTARAKTAEAELERFKEGESDRLSEIEKRLEEVAPSNPKPTREDFLDDEGYPDEDAYIDGVIDWKMSTSEKQQVTQPDDDSYQSDTLELGKAKYNDFDEVVRNENVPFTQEIIEAIEQSPNPEDIMYQLAKDPAKVFDLRINPHKIAAEVAKIGAEINSAVSKTDAPDPIVPLGGSGDNTGAVDPSKMTMDQYKAYRRQK